MARGGERTKVSGGCACGEVRFGFYEPATFRIACHCRTCQYTSGGGAAYAVGVDKRQFRITKGHPAEFSTLSEAGNLVTRVFCANCGTHLFAFSEMDPDVCSVKVGALDDPSRFRPKAHLWTSEAQPWHRKHRFTLRFRRNARHRGARTERHEPSRPEDAAVEDA